MSIAAAFAADKEAPFKAAPASSYAHHQTNGDVTIGVDAYASGEKIKAAFGKLDPYQQGVLPVLVVVQNDGKETIRLDRLKVEYVGPSGTRVIATPPKDVRYTRGPDRPTLGNNGPLGKLRTKKNPLDAWEIEGRGFAAQMLPAGQSAAGFFYFQIGLETGATIYISGMSEAKSGKDLFYFEVPLQ